MVVDRGLEAGPTATALLQEITRGVGDDLPGGRVDARDDNGTGCAGEHMAQARRPQEANMPGEERRSSGNTPISRTSSPTFAPA